VTRGEPPPDGAGLSIGEVSERTGQTVVTLRHWETMGVLPPPPRTGGKRRYPHEVLSRVAMIDLVRRAGFSLDEARELLATRTPGRPPGVRWGTLVARKRVELDHLLAAVEAAQRLLTHLARCQCPSLDGCLAEVGGSSG
jgi:MerR family redox-sensitive transcriptional activator SoxR